MHSPHRRTSPALIIYIIHARQIPTAASQTDDQTPATRPHAHARDEGERRGTPRIITDSASLPGPSGSMLSACVPVPSPRAVAPLPNLLHNPFLSSVTSPGMNHAEAIKYKDQPRAGCCENLCRVTQAKRAD